MIALLNEAERAGLIGPGSAQAFYYACELKKELKKDTCVLKGTLEHLFHCQVEAAEDPKRR